jgi:hypothetical protein
VALIEPSFVLNDGERETKYQVLNRTRDARLIANNYVLNGDVKEAFIYSHQQLVQEIRQLPTGLMEAGYTTVRHPSDPSMMRVGLAQDPANPASFRFSHETNAPRT